MNQRFTKGLGMGLLLALVPYARGLAVADLATAEAAPSATDSVFTSFDWRGVYNYKGASAVAVDHYWLLTAAHVADDAGAGTLTVDGTLYTPQEVVYHASEDDPRGNPTADLALVRFDQPFPLYYLLAEAVLVDSEVAICGFGFSGAVVSTSQEAYFTQTGTVHNVRRWGSNRIDANEVLSYTGPLPLGTTENYGFRLSISTARANAGATAFEAGCNVYDSGGGMFAVEGGTWRLVGIMTQRYGAEPRFTGNFAVGVPHYADWIRATIGDYDSDRDGLPDWWEEQFSGDAMAMEAIANPDGDRFTNYEEWLCDTDPTSATSFFRTRYAPPSSLVLENVSTNRRYQLEFCSDLAAPEPVWIVEKAWFEGVAPQMVEPVVGSSSNGFYRVRVGLK